MKNLLLILAVLLAACGSDSDSVSPFGPETLIGDWDIQKLEYSSYFHVGTKPGEQSGVVVLDEPVVYEAPTVSGITSFDGEVLLINIMMAHIELVSGSYQYVAASGAIDVYLGQDQSLRWGYDFSGENLILFVPDLPGSDIVESKLYYKKKQ